MSAPDSSPAFALGARDTALVVGLTICWGINWPIMKAGVTGFPPLFFRVTSIWLGLPVLWLVLRALRVPLAIAPGDRARVAGLAVTNMVVWHLVAIVALQQLSSGRAAILGYTMPIFAAIWGAARYGDRLAPRAFAGIAAASLGVVLLLWHEFANLAGTPGAALAMLGAAAVWAVGTQQMRRTTVAAPTLAIVFWMTLLSALAMSIGSILFERDRWAWPGPTAQFAIAYNAVFIFGFSQPVWLVLARKLPPLVSSMSVMMIPVLGVFSGAWWLGETLHWQDLAAVGLVIVAIAAVMWPTRKAQPE